MALSKAVERIGESGIFSFFIEPTEMVEASLKASQRLYVYVLSDDDATFYELTFTSSTRNDNAIEFRKKK